MNIKEFLKAIALNLITSDTYYITSHSKEYKLGILYESDKTFILPYYCLVDDNFILRVSRYDSNLEKMGQIDYESEDDVGLYLDSLKDLKESELNKELCALFSKMAMFIKEKEKYVIN